MEPKTASAADFRVLATASSDLLVNLCCVENDISKIVPSNF